MFPPLGEIPQGKGAFIMEKVLNLKMPGVQEMGRKELKEVDGGNILWYVVKWVLLGIAWDTLNDPASAKESFMKGFNAK